MALDFPLGFWDVKTFVPYTTAGITRDFPVIAAAGFNLIHSQQFAGNWPDDTNPGSGNTDAELVAYLDAAQAQGLQCLIPIPQTAVSIGGSFNGTQHATRITNRVNLIKTHPALYGYELYDEPDTRTDPAITPTQLINAYNTIRAADPGTTRPVSIISYQSAIDGTFFGYAAGFDVMIAAYLQYPYEGLLVAPDVCRSDVINMPGKTTFYMPLVYNIINDSAIWPSALVLSDRAARGIGGDVVVGTDSKIYTCKKGHRSTSSNRPISGSDWATYWRLRGATGAVWTGDRQYVESVADCTSEYPSLQQMRFQSYYAVMKGAKGLIFNGYRFNSADGTVQEEDISRDKNPNQWGLIATLGQELKSLLPVLATTSVSLATSGITIDPLAPIEAMVKTYLGKTYLFLVNPSTDQRLVRTVSLNNVTFPNPVVTEIGKTANLALTNASFTVPIPGFEVRIFRISP